MMMLPPPDKTPTNALSEDVEDAPLQDVSDAASPSSAAILTLEDDTTEEADATDISGRNLDWAEAELEREASLKTREALRKANALKQQARLQDDEDDEPTCAKGDIEALLFMTNRPLPVEEMAILMERSLDETVEALTELIGDYAFRSDSSLEIDDSEEGYILQVRKPYTHLMNTMIPMDLSSGALRTLSVLAIRAPMLQKELIDLRGASAYDHVKELLRHKLVSKNRSGVSYRLNVTPVFHQLFKLTGDKSELDVLVESEMAVERDERQRFTNRPLPEREETSITNLGLALELE
jgi:segregation and condensation protein B